MQLLSALVFLGSITATAATDTPSLKTLFDELRKKIKPVARPKEFSHTTHREAGKPSVKLAEECNPGCPASWLGDYMCDSACDVPQCSHDHGDCGTFPDGRCLTESCDWGVKLSKLSEMPDMVSFSCKNDLMDEQFSVQELYLGGTPEYDAHDRVTFMMNYNYTGSNSNLFTVIKFFNKEEGVKFRLGKEHGMWHFDPHDGRPITGSSNLPHGWTTSDFTGFRIKVKAGKRDLAYCNVLMDVAHHEDEHAHDHHEDEHAHDHHEDEHTDEHPPEYPPM